MCAQLLVYVRFFNKEKKEFYEDVLGVTPLQTSTRGEDIYLAIKEMLTKRGIELKPQIEPLFVLSLFDLTVSCCLHTDVDTYWATLIYMALNQNAS